MFVFYSPRVRITLHFTYSWTVHGFPLNQIVYFICTCTIPTHLYNCDCVARFNPTPHSLTLRAGLLFYVKWVHFYNKKFPHSWPRVCKPLFGDLPCETVLVVDTHYILVNPFWFFQTSCCKWLRCSSIDESACSSIIIVLARVKR